MTEALDWITVNPWAVAAIFIAFSVLGYAVTRPVALRGAAARNDPTAWIMLCMGLYPDTRAALRSGTDDEAEDDPAPEGDAGDGGGD